MHAPHRAAVPPRPLLQVVSLKAPRPRLVKACPKAHMVFTTCITFSPDGAYVLSASADASACLNSTHVVQADLKK